MIDIKVIPEAGGIKDFVEILQIALQFVRTTPNVKGVCVSVITDNAIHDDYAGDLDMLAAASGLLNHKIHREWDDS